MKIKDRSGVKYFGVWWREGQDRWILYALKKKPCLGGYHWASCRLDISIEVNKTSKEEEADVLSKIFSIILIGQFNLPTWQKINKNICRRCLTSYGVKSTLFGLHLQNYHLFELIACCFEGKNPRTDDEALLRQLQFPRFSTPKELQRAPNKSKFDHRSWNCFYNN